MLTCPPENLKEWQSQYRLLDEICDSSFADYVVGAYDSEKEKQDKWKKNLK